MGVVGLGAPTMFLIVYPSVVANKDAMPIAMGFLVLTQSLGQFLGSSIMPAVLGAGGWAAAGAFALVLGLVGTALLALVRLEAPAKDAAQRSK